MRYLQIFFLILIFSSCQKVIDVELRETEPKVVIEGVITDHPGDAQVKISETSKFYEETGFNGLGLAEVEVTEVGGKKFSFTETEKGIYKNTTLMALPGRSYVLNVKVKGQEFTASSVMPSKVLMDSLYVADEFIFTEKLKIPIVRYTDPAGEQNNYFFEQWINSEKVKISYLYDDDYTNGRPNEQKLYYIPEEGDEDLKSGDTVRVNMYNVERQLYKYWFSVFRASSGQSGAASPANPVTNIKGGALGYFSAQTRQTKSVIVP